MSASKVLDGGAGAPELTGEFNVNYASAMIYGVNLSGAIPLEVKCGPDWIPVVKDGAAVSLDNTDTNPLGIYVNGQYRLVAPSLGATERVYVEQ